jgi:hypothetical protein
MYLNLCCAFIYIFCHIHSISKFHLCACVGTSFLDFPDSPPPHLAVATWPLCYHGSSLPTHTPPPIHFGGSLRDTLWQAPTQPPWLTHGRIPPYPPPPFGPSWRWTFSCLLESQQHLSKRSTLHSTLHPTIFTSQTCHSLVRQRLPSGDFLSPLPATLLQ